MPPAKTVKASPRPHTGLVPIEVERKFVAAQAPLIDQFGPAVSIRQGYVAVDGDVTVRVRITGDGSWLTVKGGGGLARTEVEVAIDADDAEALWPHTVGRRIGKTRHRIPLDTSRPLVAEVDVFDGDLAGLCLIEVEFDSVDAAEAFDPPAWFGSEVTGNPGWSNAALARHGRPPSP